MERKNIAPGIYLCRVSGLQYTDHMILKYDGEFWWRYTIIYTNLHGDRIAEGWCGIDSGVDIEEIVQLIKADKL